MISNISFNNDVVNRQRLGIVALGYLPGMRL